MVLFLSFLKKSMSTSTRFINNENHEVIINLQPELKKYLREILKNGSCKRVKGFDYSRKSGFTLYKEMDLFFSGY